MLFDFFKELLKTKGLFSKERVKTTLINHQQNKYISNQYEKYLTLNSSRK